MYDSTIYDVLRNAANAAHRRIVWLYPNRSVVAFLSGSHGPSAIDLDRPAGTDQLRAILKQMALVANILTPVHVHALRHGATQDIARWDRDRMEKKEAAV